jgi:hypothetical protein
MMNSRIVRPDGVDAEALAYLEDQLADDEVLLWVGTTHAPSRMRRVALLAGISSLFMLFLCSGILLLNNPSPLPGVLAAIFWIGLPALIIWRMSVDLGRTLYAITDQRALILRVGKPNKTESYPPDEIEFLRFVRKKEGRGDLYFTELRGRSAMGHPRRVGYRHGFLAIDEVEEVAPLMRRTFPEAKATE